MHDPLRVLDYSKIQEELPERQSALKSLVPLWLKLGFAVKSRGKLHMMRKAFDRVSILELNRVYMEHFGQPDSPFVLHDDWELELA